MNFSSSEPRIAVEHLYSLSRLWGGAGDLVEWLGADDELPDVEWSRELIKARIATAVIGRFQSRWLRYLPKSAADWQDLIGQQVVRTTARLDHPTAHTDWSATISEFGRYPVQTYIERRPIASFDTPYSRTLKAACSLALRADDLAAAQLGPRPLSPRTRRMFDATLKLPALAAAAGDLPSAYDLAVCRSGGGVWLIISRLAEELAAIWSADPAAQIKTLAPILPQFNHQLFELSTVGAIVSAVRQSADGAWRSESPIGAARKGRPCIGWKQGSATLDLFYQTVPPGSRSSGTPYASTARDIGGVLRPDIWIDVAAGPKRTQLVIECKFSLDPGYVASGILQSMAYSLEFPVPSDVTRRHISVGPTEVVTSPTYDGTLFHLCNPLHVAELVSMFVDSASGSCD